MEIGFSAVANHHFAQGSASPAGGLVERFNRLMETMPSPPPSGDNIPTAISQFVRDQQSFYKQVDEKAQAFGRDATSMTVEEAALHHIELMQAVGRAQTQFTATTAVAQGAKSGLQTLMKNQ